MAGLRELANLLAIANVEEAERNFLEPPRTFHPSDNPFDTLSNAKFLKTYRLAKNLVYNLIYELQPYLAPPSRSSALDISTKVLTALHFYGTGGYQFPVGQNINSAISQPFVSRVISEVTEALNRPEIFNNHVYFPRNIEELQEKRKEFYQLHNFAGVIGCLDCTHVAIYPPTINDPAYPEVMYVNRKNYHSINTQLICDAKLKIINVCGSTNDAFIWNNANVKMENLHRQGFKSYFLLGDSGYPLRSYLPTSLLKPVPGTAEEAFNNKLTSVRSVIERCNGVLKIRFRCLLKHRTLHYRPEKASQIIKACTVLHNICVSNNLPDVPPEEENRNLDFGIFNQINNENVAVRARNRINLEREEGRRMRRFLIRNNL